MSSAGWSDRPAPNQRVAIFRIDVVVDRENDLAAIGLKRSVPCKPRQTSVRAVSVGELQEDDRAKIVKRLVHDHAADASDRPIIAQMAQEHRLHRDRLMTLDSLGRDLAEDRGENRRARRCVIAVTSMDRLKSSSAT